MRNRIAATQLFTLISLFLYEIVHCEIIKFQGDWIIQDHYKMQTGEKLLFDFKTILSNSLNGGSNDKHSENGNSTNSNNLVYDIQIIDHNEQADKKYLQLCQINEMKIIPFYEQGKTIYQSYGKELIQDFRIINSNIIFYIFTNGTAVISSFQSTVNDNNQQEIIINQLFEDQSTITVEGETTLQISYSQRLEKILVYLSNGDLFYLDISQLLQFNQSDEDTIVKQQKQYIPPKFLKIKGFPKHENAKKVIFTEDLVVVITINGQVHFYALEKKQNKIIQLKSQLLEIIDEPSDYVDVEYSDGIFILLDMHRGIFFYQYLNDSQEIVLNEDFRIEFNGGLSIAIQQLKTIIVTTQSNTIFEYYIDYHHNDYILNNEYTFDSYINSISVEENYLFVSAQSRNSNFFTPLNILKNTFRKIESHQTMIKFGLHNMVIKFSQIIQQKNLIQQIEEKLTENHNISKDKKIKVKKEQQQMIEPQKQRVFITLIDRNRLEIVPYYHQQESLVCSSESTQKLLSNVNSKYEYTILYNSTDCQEKERFYKIEKQNPSTLDLRKSYCNTHGTVTFEIDFTHYEQEEFELGLIFLFLFIVIALMCFRQYKNNKLEKMFALRESMFSEQPTSTKRKRLNLQYESVSLLPTSTFKQD